MKYDHVKKFLFLLFPILIFSSCDEVFVPLEDKSESPFSMYGFLDASADTQWIRVIPIRNQLEMLPEKPEMNVTIQNIESKAITAMSDSLFHLRQGFYVLNSWSTVNIEPEQTYRIEGKVPGGLKSSVTINIPKDFPFPNVDDFQGGKSSGILTMSGIDLLGDVKAVWHIRFFLVAELMKEL